MKTLPIALLEIDSSGSMFVGPKTDGSYEYIYRDANGLRWDRQRRALHAYEPARWKPAELLQHMAVTLRDSCDEAIVFTGSTSWRGVPVGLQGILKKVLENK